MQTVNKLYYNIVMQPVKNINKNSTPIYIIGSKDKQKNHFQILPKPHIFLKIDYLIVTSHGNFLKSA